MNLSIVIPIYNERGTLRTVIERILAVEAIDIKEIILVDDGSSDGTREDLRKSFNEPIFKKCFHKSNQGKGAALRTGFRQASGEIIVIQDADLEYNPAELPRLIEPIIHNQADVVFGSRFKKTEEVKRTGSYWRTLGNRFLTKLSNMTTRLNLTDIECCYKLFRKEVLEAISIEENRFGVEPELTAKFAYLGLRISEVGISYHGRTYAEGKKIGRRDGLRAVYVILKYGLFRSQGPLRRKLKKYRPGRDHSLE